MYCGAWCFQVYQDFMAKITGLEDRRKRIKDAKDAEVELIACGCWCLVVFITITFEAVKLFVPCDSPGGVTLILSSSRELNTVVADLPLTKPRSCFCRLEEMQKEEKGKRRKAAVARRRRSDVFVKRRNTELLVLYPSPFPLSHFLYGL